MADLPLPQDAEDSDLFQRLKDWFDADSEHSEKWRKEAEEDYAFAAGDQWSADDRAKLKKAKR